MCVALTHGRVAHRDEMRLPSHVGECCLHGLMQRSSLVVQAVITEFPDLVNNGVIDLLTGSAPLHAAARGGSAEVVKAVLDAGADIEARDGNGWNALRLARKNDHSDCEGVLLRAGALDPQAETWPGGATSAPVSNVLDAGASSNAPQQESKSASPASDSNPQHGGETESEHSVSQTGCALGYATMRNSVHLTPSPRISQD